MSETLQPYRGTFSPEKSPGDYLARHGWPNTADADTGGDVIVFKADGAIKVGDAVVLSTVGKVKIATSGTRVGVCVGGIVNGKPSLFGPANIGYSFADASIVFIRVNGTVVCPSTGTVNIGDRVIISDSTAGAVKAGTTAGSVIGMALTASSVSANVTILMTLS